MSLRVSVELIGRGAHRRLRLDFPEAKNVCPGDATEAEGHQKISISFQLPPALMVDPYELDIALSSDVNLHLDGNLDLERCR